MDEEGFHRHGRRRHAIDGSAPLRPAEKWKRAAISAFVVFTIVAVYFSPDRPRSQHTAVEAFFFPYLNWTRTLQQWRLFVPNPRTYARKYRVEITFRDGSVIDWHRPYPPNWAFFARHLSYNFQKWDLSNSYLESYSWLREDLLAYVERLYWNPINPPVDLRLIASSAPTPPPRRTGYVQHEESELLWQDQTLYQRKAGERPLK